MAELHPLFSECAVEIERLHLRLQEMENRLAQLQDWQARLLDLEFRLAQLECRVGAASLEHSPGNPGARPVPLSWMSLASDTADLSELCRR